MSTVLLILGIVILVLFVNEVNWDVVWRRWRMLRVKQQLERLLFAALSLLVLTVLIAGLLI